MRITDLDAGETYVVVRDFRDDDGVLVQVGDRQTVEGVSFLAAFGGFEVRFRQETLRLLSDHEAVDHVERFLRPE